MPNKFLSRLLLLLLTCWLVAGTGLPVAAGENEAVDPYAAQLLRGMCDFIGTAESFTYVLKSSNFESPAAGLTFEVTTETHVAVRRPDRFWAEIRSEQVHNRFLYDGERLQIHHLLAYSYATREAPRSIDETLRLMEVELGIFLPLADILSSDSYRFMMEGVEELSYVGLEAVGGLPCHHLYVQQQDMDWQIWIEDGSMLVPRKLRFDFKGDEGSPIVVSWLSEWDFAAHLPDAVFKQAPPPNALRIGLRSIGGGTD